MQKTAARFVHVKRVSATEINRDSGRRFNLKEPRRSDDAGVKPSAREREPVFVGAGLDQSHARARINFDLSEQSHLDQHSRFRVSLQPLAGVQARRPADRTRSDHRLAGEAHGFPRISWQSDEIPNRDGCDHQQGGNRRTVHSFGDLFVTQPFDVFEDHDQPPFGLQAEQRALHFALNLLSLDVGFDLFHRIGLRQLFDGVERFVRPRRQPLAIVETTMRGQPVKPRAEARFAAKLPGLLPGAQKDFLRQFLGGLALSGHGPRQPVSARVITSVKLRKHFDLPGGDQARQVSSRIFPPVQVALPMSNLKSQLTNGKCSSFPIS